MNRSDVKLLIICGVIALVFLLFIQINKQPKLKKALVYYDNLLILEIDLSLAEQEYHVDGYNGLVSISAGNGRIKVNEEDSPLHLCSKQGYIYNTYETIVCLPNKIIIEIVGNEQVDSVVK